MELDFLFKSSDHLRYENGKHVSGPHGGARRAVKVEPNINGGEGYTVTVYNLDGNHPVWQNNVQMAPKQMKLVDIERPFQSNLMRMVQGDKKTIILRGYGHDAMGATFADYGLTINMKDAEVEKCTLHMYDRGVDIEYEKQVEEKINPLNISDDPLLNKQHRLNNLIPSFENDLVISFQSIEKIKSNVTIGDFVSLIVYYSIDLMIEYYDKATVLPKSIINDIKSQIMQAAENTFDVFKDEEIRNDIFFQIDKKIWEENIVAETHQYMHELKSH